MVEADFTGDYLTVEVCKDGDVGEILGEGEYVDREINGKTKKILDIPVVVNGVKKLWSPWNETGKAFVKAWGKDTIAWIGKKFTIKFVNYKSFGKTKTGIEADPVKDPEVIKPKA